MPTQEEQYRNREIDAKFKNLESLIREKHDDVMIKISGLDAKVTFTNGKVRKITMALLVIGGVVIGQALNLKEIIQLFLHAI